MIPQRIFLEFTSGGSAGCPMGCSVLMSTSLVGSVPPGILRTLDGHVSHRSPFRGRTLCLVGNPSGPFRNAPFPYRNRRHLNLATAGAAAAPMTPSRVGSLDGLRGLAGLTVVVGHVVLLLAGSWSVPAIHAARQVTATEGTLLYALWNGRGAVLIFFALSGYVLTLPFASPSARFSPGYYVKRWARIGIPYLVMTIVVMTAAVWLSRLDSQSLWPAIMFDRPPSIGDVIEWGTLIGLPNVSAFNSVVWTLVVEIRLSMLLPIVIIAYRRFGIAPCWR